MPAALSAALNKLLGSCSAHIHSTHTTTNNDVFFLVHANSSGLQLHFTFSMSSSCRAAVDDRAGHVFQPTRQQHHCLVPPLVSFFSAPMMQSFVQIELSTGSCNKTIKLNALNLENVA
jgi:hypothetical protein